MSEATEMIERGYANFNERDYEAILEFLDPEIEWRNPEAAADADVWHGVEGARTWLEDFFEMFSATRFVPQRVIEVDESRVLVVGTAHVTGRESGLEVDAPFANLWTIRDQRATALQMYIDHEQAYAALGLKAD
jgi:ketosteroid isomerase-like protein